ncbi:MAG: nucleotidyltransferase domain-containing protein [Burkholderiaceae bacterium]
MLKDTFERIVEAVATACREVYGDRLVALALFGSVARGTMRPDSDIDLLLIVDPLPPNRRARLLEFEAVDERVAPTLAQARKAGVNTFLSPVLKTPEELRAGSFLHLDLPDEAQLLWDPAGTLRGYLDDLRARLKAMGARRIGSGASAYWVLKPDYRWGDRIEL